MTIAVPTQPDVSTFYYDIDDFDTPNRKQEPTVKIQTNVPESVYKTLKIVALANDITLRDLLEYMTETQFAPSLDQVRHG